MQNCIPLITRTLQNPSSIALPSHNKILQIIDLAGFTV